MNRKAMDIKSRIYVAGHRGMVGSAILRKLAAAGHANLITRTSRETDLRDQRAVDELFRIEQPGYVFLAAARVGGIVANYTYLAEFIYDNLMIESNIINAARAHGAEKLLFLGSSCIYPKLAPQPIKEEYLLTGALEPTNEAYAVAKIAGIKLCQAYRRQYGCNFISLMPTNLYGPGDNFDLEGSHVIPAMIRKFVDAKEKGANEVVLWGTGSPRREFLHVDDLAAACVFLMERYDSPEIINVGVGEDITISGLAELVRETVGFTGGITYDSSKPDGTPRKLLDVSRINALGWRAEIPLREGLARAVEWYLENRSRARQGG